MQEWLHAHIGWLFAGIVILTIWLLSDSEDCPRTIYGYNCRGKACDHSPELVRKAKRDMGIYN